MPIVVLFAGPNGSGKSTITEGYRKLSWFPARYLNADELAKGRPETSQEDRERAAFREARRLRRAGFTVHLVFVATSTSAINAGRVARRFLAGGHDVPLDKIHARYLRSLHLMPRAIEEADSADVFDNSGRQPLLCLQRSLEKSPWTSPDLPDYLKAALTEPLAERLEEQTSLSAAFGPLSLPDEADGEYAGEIVRHGPHYLVQQTEPHGPIRHDRLLLENFAHAEVGANVTVRYRDAASQVAAC